MKSIKGTNSDLCSESISPELTHFDKRGDFRNPCFQLIVHVFIFKSYKGINKIEIFCIHFFTLDSLIRGLFLGASLDSLSQEIRFTLFTV